MDIEITPKGWELTIFGRERSEPYLTQLIECPSQLQALQSCERATNGRRIVKKWGLDSKIEEIHGFLGRFVQEVDEAMRTFQGQ